MTDDELAQLAESALAEMHRISAKTNEELRERQVDYFIRVFQILHNN